MSYKDTLRPLAADARSHVDLNFSDCLARKNSNAALAPSICPKRLLGRLVWGAARDPLLDNPPYQFRPGGDIFLLPSGIIERFYKSRRHTDHERLGIGFGAAARFHNITY